MLVISRLRLTAPKLFMTCLVTMSTYGVASGTTGSSSTVAHRDTVAAAASTRLKVERFVLANGLRVVVHTDRRSPIVAVNVRYAVGSRDETPERSGFAHLFEHLMFNGSDNAPGEYGAYMRELGASRANAHTMFDDTTFEETVPTGALERTLFLEADRMGHMTVSIDQAALDRHRGVVQNEKRQDENQSAGRGTDIARERLFPADHPYGHSVIGSMATLDAATVEDVRRWHQQYYVPANAVLTLAGDIDAATARRLAIRYFGALPSGRAAQRKPVNIPRLPTARADTLSEAVRNISVTRHWATPGTSESDGPALDMTAKILGTLNGAWLDKALIRDRRLVSSLQTSAGASADAGIFVISYTVADGINPAQVADEVDRVLSRFMREGPTDEDIERVVMREIGWQTASQENIGSKASMLGEGELLAGDPNLTSRLLETQAGLLSSQIREAARRWLTRPAYSLTLVPGPARPYVEAVQRKPVVVATSAGASAREPAVQMPPLQETPSAHLPNVSRRKLSNGMTLVHALRPGVPLTRLVLSFPAGTITDPRDAPGAQKMLVALMRQGAGARDAATLASLRERLGANVDTDVTIDRTVVTVTLPSVRLVPVMGLLADMIRHPTMSDRSIAKAREERRSMLEAEAQDPKSVAWRAMLPLLYGPASSYARGGAAGAASLADLTPERLEAAQRAWLRPEAATMYVVSDLPTTDIDAAAERTFGSWRSEGPPGTPDAKVAEQASPQVVVIDRPGSPQSLLLAAERLPAGATTSGDWRALRIGTDALGSRISHALRDRLGWSYGTSTGLMGIGGDAPIFWTMAPVQADRTMDAVAVIRDHIRDFIGETPITAPEITDMAKASARRSPGLYQDSSAIVSAMMSEQHQNWGESGKTAPIDEGAPDRSAVALAARQTLDPNRLIWVIVGDAAMIRAQTRSAAADKVLKKP